MQIGLSDFPELALRAEDINVVASETDSGWFNVDKAAKIFSPDEEVDEVSQPSDEALPNDGNSIPRTDVSVEQPSQGITRMAAGIKTDTVESAAAAPPETIFETGSLNFRRNPAGHISENRDVQLPENRGQPDVRELEVRGARQTNMTEAPEPDTKSEQSNRKEPAPFRSLARNDIPAGNAVPNGAPLPDAGRQNDGVSIAGSPWQPGTDIESPAEVFPEPGIEGRFGIKTGRTLAPVSVFRPPAEVPSGIVQQVSSAISRLSDGKLELRLDPPELGRVTISFSSTDSGMTAQIVGEKQEVVDMLRRHSEVFARELARGGIEGAILNFSFKDGGGEPKQERDVEIPHTGEYFVQEAGIPTLSPPIVENGLDVRF